MSTLLQWLQSQPPEVRESVALLLAPVIDEPRFNGLEFLVNEPVQTFERWIEEQEASLGNEAVAKVLELRALVHFFVIDHFGSKAQWENIAEGCAESAVRLQEQGHGPKMTGPLERIAQSALFRQRLWERCAGSWATLINGSLSNEQLRYWLLASREA